MANQNDGRDNGVRRADPNQAATDPSAAARQDQMKRDHDALADSARRVEGSVPDQVRDQPVPPAKTGGRTASEDNTTAARNADEARRNAEAARNNRS